MSKNSWTRILSIFNSPRPQCPEDHCFSRYPLKDHLVSPGILILKCRFFSFVSNILNQCSRVWTRGICISLTSFPRWLLGSGKEENSWLALGCRIITLALHKEAWFLLYNLKAHIIPLCYIGLAKEFVQAFFCKMLWKTWTNSLANSFKTHEIIYCDKKNKTSNYFSFFYLS